MFLTESPVVGTYIKKQGSVNIPLYKTHIKDTTYSHIGKKAVNYGKETKLPEIEKIASSPFESFTKAPKKTKGAKWREEEISAEKLLDSRESRLENVMGKSIQTLMNPVILDDNEYNPTVFDNLQDSIKKEMSIIKSKVKIDDKGKYKRIKNKDKLDIDLAASSVSGYVDKLDKESKKKTKKPDFMDTDKKQEKRKGETPLKLTKNKKVKQDIAVVGEKRKKLQKTVEIKKKRKLNPTNKRKGDTLENPRKKKKKI